MSAVLNFKSHLTDLFAQALREVAPDQSGATVLIERPKQASHGDYACNLGDAAGDYLKLVTRLSELVDVFLEAGRFQELCDIYNTIYSYSLSGKFKTTASGMVEYFFRSKQFIERLIKAFRFLGKYETEGALRLAKVLRIYLICPLLDSFSAKVNPNIRKFLFIY